MEQNISTNNLSLQIDNGNIPYLTEAAKWAKFLAIVGIVISAIIVICGFLVSPYLSAYFNQIEAGSSEDVQAASRIGLVILYSLVGILTFIPNLLLLNFSLKTKTAIRNNDQVYLNSSLKNLKSFFKYCGVILVIVLCFYAIVAIFAAVGGYTFMHS